ncbi:MAG: tyrosine-type recombinase/integrase [Armatimonadetes bacterium]|nr:tyrosine-type recombinase/integrase [Armatimonadota bacterium]
MVDLDARPDANILVREAVDEFIDDCRIRNLSSQTVSWYADRLRRMLSDVWEAELATVTIQHLKSVIAEMLETRAASTVNGYVRTAKTFFYYCQDNDYPVAFNPRKLKKIREPKRIPPCFTQEQVQALLKQPDQSKLVGLRDHTMMSLMLDVGLRLGELTGICVSDITLPYVKVTGKGDKERILAMSDVMVKSLRKYLRARERALQRAGNKTELLFFTRTCERLPNRRVDFILKAYGEQAGVTGVRVSAHTFRFTYTSMAVRNGMSLTSLQTCLGHSTLAMTRHYAVMNDEDAFDESREKSPLAQVMGKSERRSNGSTEAK